MDSRDFAVIVWDPADGTILLANDAATRLIGIPLDDLVGRRVYELLGPKDAIERVATELERGTLEAYHGLRRLLTGRVEREVSVWTRMVELQGRRGGLTLVEPTDRLGIGLDPVRPWRFLVPIAVGCIGPEGRVTAVSADVVHVLGRPPEDVVGRSLGELVREEDAASLRGAMARVPTSPCVRGDVVFHDGLGGWADVSVLCAPVGGDDGGRQLFALVLHPEAEGGPPERAAELEVRLRRIAAEVRAAGMLDNMFAMPRGDEHPELRELTSRQWEILGLLLAGQRVPAIAASLFVSPSTVRNHLATIFRRFGVHSQSELLERLRR